MSSLDDIGLGDLLSSLLGNLLAPRVPLAAPDMSGGLAASDMSGGSFDTRTGTANISLELAAV